MPIVGIDTAGDTGSGGRPINGLLKALRVTMPAVGGVAGVTITAYVEDASPGQGIGAIIFDNNPSSPVTLAESVARTDIGAHGWYTFSGSSLATFVPEADTTYLLAVGSVSPAGAGFYNDNRALEGFAYAGTVTGLNPFTHSGTHALTSDASRDYWVYMTYTEAGGTKIPQILQHLREQGIAA